MPVDAGHVLVVELDLFPQRAGNALHDVALDALLQPIRVDDLAAVVRDRELLGEDLAGRAVDLDLARSPRRGCRCAARRRCRGPITLSPVWSLRGDGRVSQPNFSAAALITAMSRGVLDVLAAGTRSGPGSVAAATSSMNDSLAKWICGPDRIAQMRGAQRRRAVEQRRDRLPRCACWRTRRIPPARRSRRRTSARRRASGRPACRAACCRWC